LQVNKFLVATFVADFGFGIQMQPNGASPEAKLAPPSSVPALPSPLTKQKPVVLLV
jgi:hypothetical protein